MIRDVPQSVTVLNRAVLDAQGATTLTEALRNASIQAARAQGAFRTTTHVLDATSRQLVRERWGFALTRLGYDPEAPHCSGPARPQSSGQ